MRKYILAIVTILVLSACSCCFHKTENLDSWLGGYEYFDSFSAEEIEEDPSLGQFCVQYNLYIVKGGDRYYAYLTANGWMTWDRICAKVEGNENEVKIVFEEFIQCEEQGRYEEGEVFLILVKAQDVTGNDVITWKNEDGSQWP